MEEAMKLEEITSTRIAEMVRMLDGEMKPHHVGSLSVRSIERNYDSLGLIEMSDGDAMQLLFHKKREVVIGVLSEEVEYHDVLFTLGFKSSPTFSAAWVSNPLQVDKVSISRKYEGRGIAQFAYARLAKIGFTVVSDQDQYLPGKMLWKKIVRLAKLENYEVLVFRTDDAENPKVYDGSNIDDADIWKKYTDEDAQKVLLAVRAKS
jgi:hypothetical protein